VNGEPCDRFRLLVQADHDGELGVAEAADLQVHLAGCAGCRALRAELAELSARLRAELPRHAAPAALRAALQAQAEVTPAPVVPLRPRPRRWPSVGLAVAGAMALAASVALWLPPRGEGADEAVADHIRALQPGHLTDVQSTDQHTVKPWFDGRIDYAPPVRDFAAEGFPLIGGRLDYLGGRPVAALIYRRDKHIIDVFVWPDAGVAERAARVVNGYNVVTWAEGGMRFQAVSDVNAAELAQFAALWHQPASSHAAD
jgi:anti-sigma factor RsiW